MPKVLKISDVVVEAATLFPATNTKLLATILKNMQASCDFAPYSILSGIPQPSYDARRQISSSLMGLWRYCKEKGLPLLNFLAVLKTTGLPSTAIEDWYFKEFGTLQDYDQYCAMHGELAKFMLKRGLLILI